MQTSAKTTLEFDVTSLMKHKGLDPDIFSNSSISLTDDLNKHLAWVFQHIYSKPYALDKNLDEKIARYQHGIQHVSRTALYMPVFINLYRAFNSKEAHQIDEDDSKLLQIAMLFHDTAREGDEEDLWDAESAAILFVYLTQTLKVHPEKAKLIAEAVCNKDQVPGEEYYELVLKDQNITWVPVIKDEKNIYQKVIQCCDAEDIHRARAYFMQEKLDFYQDIAKTNSDAFDISTNLALEARSLIALQGDTFKAYQDDIKLLYENKEAYQKTLGLLNQYPNQFKLIRHFFNGGALLPSEDLNISELKRPVYDPEKPLVEDNLTALMDAGGVFFRGIKAPSAIREKKGYEPEILADLEIRKTLRRIGFATRSKKINNREKQGNPIRSLSLLGNGNGVFTPAGFVKFNPDLKDIVRISNSDIDSGEGKKIAYRQDNPDTVALTSEEAKLQIQELNLNSKMGNVEITYEDDNFRHNEVIYSKIESYDMIIFTNDPNMSNLVVSSDTQTENFHPQHQHAPLLQAIFLQNSYKTATGNTLPLAKHSGIHNQLKILEQPTEKALLVMWVEMCEDYLKKSMTIENMDFSQKNELIKVMSMYGKTSFSAHLDGSPDFTINSADANYDDAFKTKLNAELDKLKIKIHQEITDNFIKKIKADNKLLFDEKINKIVIKYPKISQAIKEYVSEIENTPHYLEIKENILNANRVKFKNFADQLASDFYKKKAEDLLRASYIPDRPVMIREYLKLIQGDMNNLLDSIFNIGLEKDLKNPIKDIALQYLGYIDNMPGKEKFMRVLALVKKLESKHLLDAETIDVIDKMIQSSKPLTPEIESKFRNSADKLNELLEMLSLELKLLQLKGCSKEELKSKYLSWQEEYNHSFLTTYRDEKIIKILQTHDLFQDEQIISLFVNRADRKNRSSSRSLHCGEDLVEHWDFVRRHLSEKKLPANLLGLIYKRLEDAFNEGIRSFEKASDGDVMFALHYFLSAYARIDLPLPRMIFDYVTSFISLIPEEEKKRVLAENNRYFNPLKSVLESLKKFETNILEVREGLPLSNQQNQSSFLNIRERLISAENPQSSVVDKADLVRQSLAGEKKKNEPVNPTIPLAASNTQTQIAGQDKVDTPHTKHKRSI